MRTWMAERVRHTRPSVFEEMGALAHQYDAVNLGIGTPHMDPPEALRAAVAEAISSGRNQYAPVRGEPKLRTAVAAHAQRFYGMSVDPEAEITITSGVIEAAYSSVLAVIDPGDEVVIFEPFYDCYVPAIRMAGGIPVAVTLHAPEFRFDPVELRAAFSPRTKAVILNTPHNPTGRVFSLEEMTQIAELCQEFDALAITDEVYEHIVFDGVEHVRMATLPGMWERTLTLASAGKTFSCTGWRIGWAIGPARLHDAIERVHQVAVYCSATPLQLAIAQGLGFPDAYFCGLAAEYQARRDLLLDGLASCGMPTRKPAGSFFVLTAIPAGRSAGGREFCTELARTAGVVPIPLETFYLNPGHSEKLVRFAYCASRDVLECGVKRLAKTRVA